MYFVIVVSEDFFHECLGVLVGVCNVESKVDFRVHVVGDDFMPGVVVHLRVVVVVVDLRLLQVLEDCFNETDVLDLEVRFDRFEDVEDVLDREMVLFSVVVEVNVDCEVFDGVAELERVENVFEVVTVFDIDFGVDDDGDGAEWKVGLLSEVVPFSDVVVDILGDFVVADVEVVVLVVVVLVVLLVEVVVLVVVVEVVVEVVDVFLVVFDERVGLDLDIVGVEDGSGVGVGPTSHQDQVTLVRPWNNKNAVFRNSMTSSTNLTTAVGAIFSNPTGVRSKS
ncbi:hypothetical protein HDU77_009182 [Chytriomyces hyalinus]|nr:hypothetical protein HDU77_009182 [Chytriomyces hyalinus]